MGGFVIGSDTTCLGDTLHYSTAYIPSSTYSWSLAGGTIISGQGTDVVDVVWSSFPDSISVFRDLARSTPLNITLPGQNLQPVLPSSAVICAGDSLMLDSGPGLSYFWSTGDSSQVVSVSYSGWIFLSLERELCGVPFFILDSTYIKVVVSSSSGILRSDISICPDTLIVLDAGAGFLSYLWSGGHVTPDILVRGLGSYWVQAVDSHGCLHSDSILLNLNLDCVWPGDADFDGLANNFDVLALGVAMGTMDSPRNNASLGWFGQMANPWMDTLANGTNIKHADCDGNGTVEALDTLAIFQNFGMSHNKGGACASGVPLQIVSLQDSVPAGDTAFFSIQLGDVGSLADSCYGIAFSISYDTSLTDSHGVLFVDWSNSWLGSDLLSFTYDRVGEEQIDLALSRMNGVDTMGFGELGLIGIVTDNDLSAKKELLTETLYLDLFNLKYVDHRYSDLCVTPTSDSVVIFQNELTQTIDEKLEISIFPNPNKGSMRWEVRGEKIEELVLYDLRGIKLRSKTNLAKKNGILHLEDLSSGVYFLKARTQSGVVLWKKVLLQH